MINILIIGNKGFIGSHAYQYFSINSEFNCKGCDVSVDYADPNYFQIDATNSDFNEVFNKFPFDICINCSGASSVPNSITNPLRDYTLNVSNIVKILEAIRKNSPQCRFINLSSAAVYGNPLKLPVKEIDICNPVSPYGTHKLIAEQMCDEFSNFYKIQSCNIRIFSAYGPGLKKQLLWDICEKALQSDTVNLHGTGEETRDFIFISDIIRCFQTLANNPKQITSVYNLASGNEISIRNLAQTILEKMNYAGNLIFSGHVREGDPMYWKADIHKIRSIGFVPEISVNEGIDKYLKWRRDIL